ncbi:hypothetical protein P9112_008286 [Eukaryota sp. TZLM1-RC]
MGTSSHNILVLFFEFLFKHKLSSSIKSILVNLALLLVTGVAITLSVLSFLFDLKLFNFIGFWFLLCSFIVAFATWPSLSDIIFPMDTPNRFASRISVILIVAAVPFFISMLSHFFLYILTLPLSMFFTEPWEDFSYAYCFSADGFCNIYHDLDWNFTFLPIIIYGLLLVPSFFISLPLIIMVLGSFCVGLLWVVRNEDNHYIFDGEYFKYLCLLCTFWSSYPGCIVLSLSISTYFLLISNIIIISNYSNHCIYIILLLVLSSYNICRLVMMNNNCDVEDGLIKFWRFYFTTVTCFSLFLLVNYIGRAFIIFLNLLFRSCLVNSLCEFSPEKYSFTENLASLLVVVVVFLGGGSILLIYSKVFRCCSQFCTEFNEFVEENGDAKDSEVVYT